MREAVMSLNKAVKWFAIYVLLTLGFAAATALATFVFVAVVPYKHEISTLFFSFLLLAGIALILIGVLIILRTGKLTLPEDIWLGFQRVRRDAYQRSQFLTKRKYGILFIFTGLTFILVVLSKF